MVRDLHVLTHLRCIDLSISISAKTAEPQPPRIDYVDHARAAVELAAVACSLLASPSASSTTADPITAASFQDSLGLANDNLELDSHAGTHMDAPWHFGPLSGSKKAKTIDEIPLDWCFRPGVVLDLRHKKAGEVIDSCDLREALDRIGYRLKGNEIVLLMTGADKRHQEKDYFSAHAGMGREGTLWLLDQGIKVIGIDGWGFDRPAGAMLKEYLETNDSSTLLPAHMVGREREYCHLEKLANLDLIPIPFGFWVACFPIKIERGSAGWIRAVALVDAV